jgi:hypothetical protein
MAFGNVIQANPTSHANSEAGKVMAKLNEIIQQDGGDLRIKLNVNRDDYMRWNTAQNRFEWYINGVIQGHLDSTAFTAD